jgi:hypothetical protein
MNSPPNAKPPDVVRHFKQTLRLIIYISTIFAATLLLAFRLLTNPIHITGHLKKNPDDTHSKIDKISIFVKGDNKVLAQTFSDEKGNFDLTFTPKQEKSFDFFCKIIGEDTILIASYKRFESDTPEMTFYIPGIRKKNTLGKTICPKCKKTDKVYEIIYTDGIPDHFDDDTVVYKPHRNPRIVDGAYYDGCIVGIAKYYCDRDDVKF